MKTFWENSNHTQRNAARQTLLKERSAQLREQKLFNDNFENI